MRDYIKKNNVLMLIVISSVLMGIIIGSNHAARLNSDVAKSIYESINKSVSESTAYKSFVKSLQIEYKSFILLFICGVAVIGAPAAVFYMGVLGYALGFSVAFLVKYYGLLGFFAAICAILPHYLILIPAFVSLGVISIGFSNKLLLGERGLRDDFSGYAVKALIIAAVIFAACIIEGFFSSPVLKKILSVIIK